MWFNLHSNAGTRSERDSRKGATFSNFLPLFKHPPKTAKFFSFFFSLATYFLLLHSLPFPFFVISVTILSSFRFTFSACGPLHLRYVIKEVLLVHLVSLQRKSNFNFKNSQTLTRRRFLTHRRTTKLGTMTKHSKEEKNHSTQKCINTLRILLQAFCWVGTTWNLCAIVKMNSFFSFYRTTKNSKAKWGVLMTSFVDFCKFRSHGILMKMKTLENRTQFVTKEPKNVLNVRFFFSSFHFSLLINANVVVRHSHDESSLSCLWYSTDGFIFITTWVFTHSIPYIPMTKKKIQSWIHRICPSPRLFMWCALVMSSTWYHL